MKSRGVTFIELIVSIAIISILSTVVSIKIKSYLLKAKDIKVEADLEILRGASNLYYMEKNRALGDSNLNTGSGVGRGELTEYIPYGDTMPVYTVTYNHIQELIDKKYLDKNILTKFSLIKTSETTVKFLSGTKTTYENCINGKIDSNFNDKELILVFGQDNVKINFWDGIALIPMENEGYVDSNCKVWNFK